MELLLAGLVHGDKVSLQADHLKLNRFVDAASLLKQGKRVTDVPELAWFNSGMMFTNIAKLMKEVILNRWSNWWMIMVRIHSRGTSQNYSD